MSRPITDFAVAPHRVIAPVCGSTRTIPSTKKPKDVHETKDAVNAPLGVQRKKKLMSKTPIGTTRGLDVGGRTCLFL